LENVRIRRQLALSYRILDRLQLNEGVCNHLTAMAPAKNGQKQIMLVIPGKARFTWVKSVQTSAPNAVVAKTFI
jgi:hypothetical protein